MNQNEQDTATPQAMQAHGKGSILHSNGLHLAFSDTAGVSMQLPSAHNKKAYQNWHTRQGITKVMKALNFLKGDRVYQYSGDPPVYIHSRSSTGPHCYAPNRSLRRLRLFYAGLNAS
jgi:hypothetical protein